MDKLKKYVVYIGIFLIVTLVTFPMLLLYTPFFKNARKVYVASAMCTTSHQWLATKFLSDEKIKDILNSEDKKVSADKENTSIVQIPKNNDNAIDFVKINNSRYTGYCLIIHNPRRVKVAASEEGGTKGELIEKIVNKNSAICGINGGGFSQDIGTNKNKPLGIIMSEGRLIYPKSEDKVDFNRLCLGAINKQGLLIVGKYTFEELKKMNVQEAISFGPVLIKDGKAIPIENDIAWGGGSAMNPKALIGQKQDGSIILMVLTGHLNSMICATLNEAQQLMLDLGAVNAMNLDGGNSVIMYKDGQLVNTPSKQSELRHLSSAIIVK
ncbi:phosphodiester glycosidase family protein [Inconstantimicrobium mannanitabidum]|uniref:Uncharacterized protein n=1 Tax=Inconstantimicrobium mannanitabidum TaxID=1604901 RepID=A0ACB5RH19_9CLOT|nr:phosphodiester glycosidase family protein [Clostridium sp. TW13]GKX68333.1 hypothetical protein rsdtw13_35910 [Clostridium sp. TW13]